MPRLHRDHVTGVLLLGIGALAVWAGLGLGTGTIRRMGPGFFPVAMGMVLGGLGVLIALRPDTATDDQSPANLRALALICAAIAAFALLVRSAGLVPAVFAAVFLSSLADASIRPLQAIGVGAVMSALAVGVFVWGLGFQAAPFGRF